MIIDSRKYHTSFKRTFFNNASRSTILTVALTFHTLSLSAASFVNEPPSLYNFSNPTHLDHQEELEASFSKSESTIEKAKALYKEGLDSLQKGQKEKGMALLEQAWQLDANFAIVGETIAMIYMKESDFENTLKTAQKLQIQSPNSHQGYMFAGYAYEGLNKPDDAKRSFLKALEIKPGAPDASWKLANDAIRNGNIDQARKYYDTALQKSPNHLRILLSLSELEFSSGNTKRAEQLLIKTIDKHQDTLQPRLMLSRLYLSTGNPKQAQEITELALKKFNNNVAALDLLGTIQRGIGKTDDAISTFQSAIKIEPTATDPRYNLALTLLSTNQIDAAFEEIKSILKISPNHLPSQILQTNLLIESKQVDKAEDLLKQLLQEHPNNADINDLAGKLALNQNNPETSLPYFQTALKTTPTSARASQLASAQFVSKLPQDSLTTLKTWLENHPEDERIRDQLAAYSTMQGKTDDAIKQYSEITRINPNKFDAYNNLALLYAQQTNLNKALQYAETAYKLAPQNAGVLDTLAVILCRKGDYKKGSILFQEAIQKAPNDMSIRFHFAEALIEIKETDNAKIILKEILSKQIDNNLRERVKTTLDRL